MCLRLDEKETAKVRTNTEPITVYKVVRVKDGSLLPPNEYRGNQYVVGDNISDRASVELTEGELLIYEIHHGMHVHMTFASAKSMCNAYNSPYHHDHKIVKCTCKIEDLVAVGHNFKTFPEYEAVFMKFHLSQSEYDYAVGVKKKSLWRRLKEIFNLL